MKIRFQNLSASAIRVLPRFYPKTHLLRSHIEKTFSSPLHANRDRFCWDYWEVSDQYRLLRTPAESFFPAPLTQDFFTHLTQWGRTHLGCQMISHPWLSAYVDGCYQNLHSDVPHGPFSFVFSLTDWKNRRFQGGETQVAKPRLLRYFSESRSDASDEEASLFESIPPRFNQLTVFDPRYPHGVRRVEGVDHLLRSRMVIHGWFTEPRPMIEGALTPKQISRPLDHLAQNLIESITALDDWSGLLSLRFSISSAGILRDATVLTHHLLNPTGEAISRRSLSGILSQLSLRFPKSHGETLLTLPLQWMRNSRT